MTANGDRLLSPYHAVRRVVAGSDAPWPGLIVRLDSGESAVMIDAPDLDPGWAGWSADPDGHLLAAVDVIRTPDGQAVLTSLCTIRLSDFLRRRLARRTPLGDGEIVTLVVSIARGLREAGAIHAEQGEWWLTDAGRPVLVTEAARAPLAASTEDVWEALRTAAESPGAWSWLDTWPTSARELLAVEARAFDVATPQPLTDAPMSTATPWPLDDHAPRLTGERHMLPSEEHPPTLLERLGRHVDADIADLVSRSLTGIWRRMRRTGGVSRRRLVAVSVTVGAAVIAVGLVWPVDGQSAPAPTSTADVVTSRGPDPIASDIGTDSTATTGAGPSPDPSDMATLVSDLLTRRTACADDVACLSDVVLHPRTVFPSGVIDADAVDRRATLVDDYGGVIVVRIDAEADSDAHPQIVVAQRTDDTWLLRDVYVAQQP